MVTLSYSYVIYDVRTNPICILFPETILETIGKTKCVTAAHAQFTICKFNLGLVQNLHSFWDVCEQNAFKKICQGPKSISSFSNSEDEVYSICTQVIIWKKYDQANMLFMAFSSV
jgi:hypothetical protein